MCFWKTYYSIRPLIYWVTADQFPSLYIFFYLGGETATFLFNELHKLNTKVIKLFWPKIIFVRYTFKNCKNYMEVCNALEKKNSEESWIEEVEEVE